MRCVYEFLPGKHLILLQDPGLIRKQARLLDLAQDNIRVRDLNDTIIYWNQGAERLYGLTHQEAVGRHVHTFLQTESAASTYRARLMEKLSLGRVADLIRFAIANGINGSVISSLAVWEVRRVFYALK